MRVAVGDPWTYAQGVQTLGRDRSYLILTITPGEVIILILLRHIDVIKPIFLLKAIQLSGGTHVEIQLSPQS